MAGWLLVALYSGVMLLLAAWSARAAVRNFAGFRHARNAPPLEEPEVLVATPQPIRVPRGWPAPEELSRRMAAAYRDYARERAASAIFLGEMAMVGGGATFGALLPAAFADSEAAMSAAAVAFGIVAGGYLMKDRGQEFWPRIAAMYERCLAPSPRPEVDPPQPVRRRRWLRWWREGRAARM